MRYLSAALPETGRGAVALPENLATGEERARTLRRVAELVLSVRLGAERDSSVLDLRIVCASDRYAGHGILAAIFEVLQRDVVGHATRTGNPHAYVVLVPARPELTAMYEYFGFEWQAPGKMSSPDLVRTRLPERLRPDAARAGPHRSRTSVPSSDDGGGRAQALRVGVRRKPPAHRNFDRGFPAAYTVDDRFPSTSIELVLRVGRSYRFDVDASIGAVHPFYFSEGEVGGTGRLILPVWDGVRASWTDADAPDRGAHGGESLTITPTTAQRGRPLYFQCQDHAYMGAPIRIV